MNHREQVQIFINGLAAKGVSADRIKAISDALLADEATVQYFSAGTLAQNLLDQKLNEVRGIEDNLRNNQNQWNAYLQQANTTLSTAERERLQAVQQATAADVAIKALAAQYNIPESEVQALYNSASFQQQQQPFQQQPQQQRGLQAPQFQQQQQQQQNGQLTSDEFRNTLGGVVNEILQRDAINARHFELTGKPWNPAKAVEYAKQQAAIGREVNLEQAWRITEGIDALEATAAENARKAEREQIEREIREKIASEQTTLPTDAQPNFGEARISAIFQQPAEGERKEQTGHHGRTREAMAAYNKLQQARRLGQPSPYDQPASTT